MSADEIRWRIFLPAGAVLAALVVVCYIVVIEIQTRHANEEVAATVQRARDSLQTEVDTDAQMFNGLIDLLDRDPTFLEIWQTGDRDQLFDAAKPVFDELRSNYRITHFYFHSPDSVCFLRVHNRSRHGDVIQRYTMTTAARTGKPCHGIELGPFGTFTLRAVHPWKIDGQVIGYIELGEEIDHITQRIRDQQHVEVALAIDKCLVQREKWEEGQRMMGRAGAWNRLADSVLADDVGDATVAVMDQHQNASGGPALETIEVEVDSHCYHSTRMPLLDVRGHDVGDYYVLVDMADEKATTRRMTFALLGFGFGITLLLGGSFWLFLGRIENQLITARNGLTKVLRQGKRKQAVLARNQAALREAVVEREQAQRALQSRVQDLLDMRNSLLNITHDLEREIADHKRSEEKLHRSESKFRTLFDTTCDAVMLLDEKGLFDCNEAALQLFGCNDKSQFCSKHPAELSPPKQPCGGDSLALANEGIAAAIEKGSHRFEWVHQRVDTGATFQAEVLLNSMTMEDRPVLQTVIRDITTRKEAEDELRREKDYTDSILSSMTDMLFVLSPNGRVVTVNQAACDVLGYSDEELIGQPASLIFEREEEAEDMSWAEEPIQGVLSTHTLPIRKAVLRRLVVEGSVTNIEKSLVTRSGITIPVLLSGSAMWDDRNKIRGIVFLALNITEQKRAEEQLHESEQRFMDVLYSADDAILLIDDETFVACNDAATRMLGYSNRDEFLLIHPSELSPPTQPDGCQSLQKAGEMMEAAFRKGFHRFEWMYRKANGEVFPVEVSLTPISYQGKSILHCLWRDLTEQKKAEAERERMRLTFQEILESMPVGVMIIGPDRRIRHANSAALDLMECGSEDEIVGRNGCELICSKDCSQCPVLESGNRIDNMEYMLTAGNQTQVPVLKTVVPITIDGELVLLETFVDITQRKIAERKIQDYATTLENNNQVLAELNEAAAAANQAKSEFLANMSHEIRTPMTAILGFSEILMGGELEREQREAASTIRRNGEYLIGIINDILDLSKIESGKLAIEKIPFSPRQVLTEVVSLMRVRASAKNLPLGVQYDGPIPQQICSDPTRLRQILINLAGNAIKFTESGDVSLIARIRDVDSDHPKLQIDVVDSGIGMDKQRINHLFQPFQQADSSTTRKFGGTGLGLAITKRLTEMLGGDISVTSTVGKGSTFSVTIETGPLKDVPLVAGPTAAQISDQSEEPASPPVTLDCRVLLVEDGPDNQRLISFLLKKAGADVVTAENGQFALDLALQARDQGNGFDVILMDMQMPVMDGYTATSRLRQCGLTSPIVALTAHAMSTDRDKCLAAGCDDYITKPVDRKKLVAMVMQYAPAKTASPAL